MTCSCSRRFRLHDDRRSDAPIPGPQAVVINLNIVTEQTRGLGIEGLVCELQLVLQSFHDILVCTLPPVLLSHALFI